MDGPLVHMIGNAMWSMKRNDAVKVHTYLEQWLSIFYDVWINAPECSFVLQSFFSSNAAIKLSDFFFTFNVAERSPLWPTYLVNWIPIQVKMWKGLQ